MLMFPSFGYLFGESVSYSDGSLSPSPSLNTAGGGYDI